MLEARANPTSSVLAAVVTYNPGDDLEINLKALSAQAPVIVVDNGSRNTTAVEVAAVAAGCRLILNRENLGIATALNQAARLAKLEGYDWLATFDQDSLAPAGALQSVIDSGAKHPSRNSIAIISMARRDRGTGADYTPPWAILKDTPTWRSVRSTITSGSLVRVDIFDKVGYFDDGLFIDSVDHDFALRCRKHGYDVIEDKTTVMEHSIGLSTSHKLLGRTIISANHSAARQYYMTRNILEVARRSLEIDRTWSWRALAYTAIGVVEVCLYERDRWMKILSMGEGVKDFVFRRFGARPQKRT